MGSTFEIRLGATTPGALPLAEQALDLIDELEQQLTVYRDDLRGQQANDARGGISGPVEVEAGLFLNYLSRAVTLAEETGRGL